jgi:hypothetical protein
MKLAAQKILKTIVQYSFISTGKIMVILGWRAYIETASEKRR